MGLGIEMSSNILLYVSSLSAVQVMLIVASRAYCNNEWELWPLPGNLSYTIYQ